MLLLRFSFNVNKTEKCIQLELQESLDIQQGAIACEVDSMPSIYIYIYIL